jgi:cyclophilin family peptidyl-prolyl cis-trans isomerase
MNVRLWAILAVLLVVMGAFSWWLSTQQIRPQREEIKMPSAQKLNEMTNPKPPKLPNATLQPGRVVVLKTNRGKIEFVLYEKDCPKTTARMVKLVQGGDYNGVTFPRAENWIIQTELANRDVQPIGIEVAKGLLFDKGSVGMARAADNTVSNTSVFFIALRPAHHLDLKYTCFGRVISGMDVAAKIVTGDQIETASLRPFTAADRKHLDEMLKVTSERAAH